MISLRAFRRPPLQAALRRSFATRKSNSVLLQNTDRVPELPARTSAPDDRRCYVWGLSETGALGMHKSLKKQSQKQAAFIQHPTRLQFAEQHSVLAVAAGYGFTAFAVRSQDGVSLFGSGINTDSQLGYQPLENHPDRPLDLLVYPAPIRLPPPVGDDDPVQIRRVSAGRAHLLALDDSGRVYALGNNAYGQCGRPIIADEAYAGSQTVHVLPGVDSDGRTLRVTDVQCGQDHSLLLTECGAVFACGWGADGQTGLGHYRSEGRPGRVRGDIEGEHIVKVSGSVDCVLALNDKGEVFGWGNSEYGQLVTDGDEQQINRPQHLPALRQFGPIVDIAAGGSYCLALNDQGDVFVWGYGLLGLGPQVDRQPQPTRIPPPLFGRNAFNAESRVQRVFCGISHSAAITNDGDLFVWGRNKHGCLGLGHQKDQPFPLKAAVAAKVHSVSLGVDHSVAMCTAFV